MSCRAVTGCTSAVPRVTQRTRTSTSREASLVSTSTLTANGRPALDVFDDGEPLINVATAAARGLGHPCTIRRYIHQGRLPAEKVGRQFLFREADLRGLFRTIPPSKAATEGYLDSLVKQVVDKFPALTDEQKRELGQLLAPSAA